MPDRHFLLALCPVDQDIEPLDPKSIARFLAHIGLISTQWKPGRYLVGSRFLSLLSFTGCSPLLDFAPDKSLSFCHVEVPEIVEKPEFRYYPDIKSPLCPGCRQPLDDWKSAEGTARDTVGCPHCDRVSSAETLVWRQRLVCFARRPILVWNIGEGEAVPAAELMEELQNLTGAAWKYSYVST